MPGFYPDKPYNQLPLLPPDAEIESKAILKKCVSARAALAGLKQAGGLIPNQAVLINTIPLLEARGSSEIENIVTTTDKLFQFAGQQEQHTDAATKEALRYRTALYHGCRSLKNRPLCQATAVEVCSIIKGVDMEIRRIPGTALANEATGGSIYTPPEGESLLQDLGNLLCTLIIPRWPMPLKNWKKASILQRPIWQRMKNCSSSSVIQ